MRHVNKYVPDSTQQHASWCCKFNEKIVQNKSIPNIPFRQSSHPTSKSKNKILITSREKLLTTNSKSFKKFHNLCPKKTLENSLQIKNQQPNGKSYLQINLPKQTNFEKCQNSSLGSPQKKKDRKAQFFNRISTNNIQFSPQKYYKQKQQLIHIRDKKQQYLYLPINKIPFKEERIQKLYAPYIHNNAQIFYSQTKTSPQKQYHKHFDTSLEAANKKYSCLYSTMHRTIQRTARESNANLQQSQYKKPLLLQMTISRKNHTETINPEEVDKNSQQLLPLIRINSITKNERIREVESQFDSQENICSQYSEVVIEDSELFQNFHKF